MLTLYFVWWRFALVIVGRASLPYLVGNNTVEKSWGVNNLRGIYNPFVRVRYVWFATSTRQGRELWSYPVSERLPTFGFLSLYFFWWQFALVTVGRTSIPYLVGNNTVKNSWYVNCIYSREFKMNTKSFGSISICVVCDINKMSPFGESTSVHCGLFHTFWLIPDLVFWQGLP